MNKFQYKGWDVIPTALPTTDRKWTASCDLSRIKGDGLEVFEGATLQFVRDTEDEAVKAACDEARIQIDNLIADPTVRLV